MNRAAHYAKGCALYHRLALAGRIEGANPHQLVSILYEELIQTIDVIAVAMERARDRVRDDHAARAQTILIALCGSLDHSGGGEIAATLAGIYRSVAMRLRRAVATADGEQIAELREGVAAIAQAWAAIGEPAS